MLSNVLDVLLDWLITHDLDLSNSAFAPASRLLAACVHRP